MPPWAHPEPGPLRCRFSSVHFGCHAVRATLLASCPVRRLALRSGPDDGPGAERSQELALLGVGPPTWSIHGQQRQDDAQDELGGILRHHALAQLSLAVRLLEDRTKEIGGEFEQGGGRPGYRRGLTSYLRGEEQCEVFVLADRRDGVEDALDDGIGEIRLPLNPPLQCCKELTR